MDEEESKIYTEDKCSVGENSMLNVFISHISAELDEAEKLRDYLEQRGEYQGDSYKSNPSYQQRHANVLILKPSNKDWKKEAKKLIKQARIVILLQGSNFGKEKKDTIGWEVKTAHKMNKPVMIYRFSKPGVNMEELELPDWLHTVDQFTGQKRPIANICTREEIKKRIDMFDLGEYNVFTEKYQRIREKAVDSEEEQKHKEELEGILFEQYKIYQKTSEDLVNRRQDVSKFYQSLNSALVVFLGAIAGFVGMPAKAIVLISVSIAGIIMDLSWYKILEAYGNLNASKMKVINLIEKQLPIRLYDAEWEVMSDKLNSKKYVSFTDSEKRVPKLFCILYGLVIVLGILLYCGVFTLG